MDNISSETGLSDEEIVLRRQLAASSFYDAPVQATLKTNQRVFARITDGIYREPASALRELIANSYDADATEVRIFTDAPRFSKIVVRDNGHGLDENTLAHIICNIGGSLKRSKDGKYHDVTSELDKNLSPKKRRLIGKLGIGLFSVSQITHHIVIVSKVKGDNKRLVCDILLRPQSEVEAETDEDNYVTGKAEITYVPAEDLDSSGTEITLLNVRPFVQESLQSKLLWNAIQFEREAVGVDVEEVEFDLEDELKDLPREPDFHIGEIDPRNPEVLITTSKLPWLPSDEPVEKFRKLVAQVGSLTADSKRGNVKLLSSLDSYLRMIWSISLSVPIKYIEKHPYEVCASDNVEVYLINNGGKGSAAEKIELKDNETLESRLGLAARREESEIPFSVIIDGVELRRPISIAGDADKAKGQLMFVGRANPSLSSVPETYRGGELEFEYYMLWNSKVVPLEHNGCLIRINGANGTLFDSSFLDYQISEQTRLRQLSGEIFAIKGLDSALNIDRESFNIAHPHFQYLKRWMHNALRQFMSKHKALSKDTAALQNKVKIDQVKSDINAVVVDFTESRSVRFYSSAKGDQPSLLDEPGTISINRESVVTKSRNATSIEKARMGLHEDKLVAVADILESYGLLSSLSDAEIERLIGAIGKIFLMDIKK
ncbi:ATP-binding protein [Pseudomonas fluorescens]|uniref:ATP-binding protein n=1 Tax=Pseudomonas fluorescens TaxID=294 RepID=UPI001240C37F|nr:ATP-binding protein [Pseudomonas fluorescens]VVQ34491.1 DNA mismatch repair protein MutL [Pseudomonas fluorescens]